MADPRPQLPQETVDLVEDERPSFLAEIGVTDVDSFIIFLRKRKVAILPVIFLSVLFSLVSAFREVDIYATAAKVQLAQDPVDPTTARYSLYYDSSLPTDFVNTEIQLLKSRQLAALVAARPEVVAAFRGQESAAIGAFMGGIYVQPIRDTRLVEVGCESEDARHCTLFANALADTYCRYKLEERNKLTFGNLHAIAEQLPKVAKRIEDNTRELDKFLRAEGTSEAERDLLLSRLKTNNEALSIVQRERIKVDSELEAIERVKKADRPIESAPTFAASANVQRLRAEHASAEHELALLLDRYPEDSPLPKVKAVKTRRDELRLELTSEIETIRNGLVAYRDTKLAEEQTLEKVVTSLRDEARLLTQQSQRTIFLQKEIENDRRLYDELLRRSTDLASYSQVEGSTVKIVDRALEPNRPIRPNRPRTIMLGLVFGLVGGFALSYLLERLDSRIRSAEDVKSYFHANVLALVPEVPGLSKSELERLAVTAPEAPFTEAFRRLRAQLHASAPARVVVITSGAPSEGKTVTSINLAIATANAGSRVLLVDADMRNPAVHKGLKLDLEPGLGDLLSDATRNPFSAVQEYPDVANLFVLPAGLPPRNAAELLAGGDRFPRLIEKLKTKFDRIIIDTPPAAFLSDAAIMAPVGDTWIVVISTRHSRRRATRLALGALTGVAVKPTGVVLNHMHDRGIKDLYYEYYKPRVPRAEGEPASTTTRSNG
ncbi:MAG: GumC family protein [Planctomycetota bacterium]